MISSAAALTIHNHDRDLAGLTYVYPVLSRRAGGVSIGVNLNPNNACNWHCAYCQVPDLVRGTAPQIDLALLEHELRAFLEALVHGDWLQRNAPEEAREIRDIAFSGNGEPTSAEEFPDAVSLVARLREEFGLAPRVAVRLITNGSLMSRRRVQEGVRRLAAAGGEVWFKVDAGDAGAIERTNGVRLDPESIVRRLASCVRLCPTWVQTCMFRWDGAPPSEKELAAYIDVVKRGGGEALRGVLLYGLARPSMQAERIHLAPLSGAELDAIGERMKNAGLTVRVSP